MQGDVEDGLHTLHVGLGHMPRFAVGDILIAEASKVHGLFLCIAELEDIEEGFHLLFHVLEFLNGVAVDVKQFATFRNNTIEIFLCELERTVDEVAVNSHQFVVVAVLEILPGEVVVFRFWSVGREHIAQNVLLAREVFQIFVEPDGPVA